MTNEAIPGQTAANIHRLRVQRGWSLRELARRAELDVGTVRNAEAARNMTLGTLVAVANALELPLHVLVRSDAHDGGIEVVRRAGGDLLDAAVQLLTELARVPLAERVELAHVRLREGGTWVSDRSDVGVVERFFVMAGEVEASAPGHTAALQAGDLATFRVAGPYRYTAITDGSEGLLISSAREHVPPVS